MDLKNVAIIGGGPAGLTSGIYLGRAGLQPDIYVGDSVGGMISLTNSIQNYSGISNIEGFQLMNNMEQQALNSGANIIENNVNDVQYYTNQDEKYFLIKTKENNTQIRYKSIIIATGTIPKKLNIENFDQLIGNGISFCALCDGNFCKNKTAVIVGGGNTAINDAIYLSKIANNVIVVNRSQKFRASECLYKKASNIDNISILKNVQIKSLLKKDNILNKIYLTNDLCIQNSMLFCCIGNIPNTDFLQIIEKDSEGYIKTFKGTCTNVEGIFACGDCANPQYKQAIIASGTGAMASIDCLNYLNNC